MGTMGDNPTGDGAPLSNRDTLLSDEMDKHRGQSVPDAGNQAPHPLAAGRGVRGGVQWTDLAKRIKAQWNPRASAQGQSHQSGSP